MNNLSRFEATLEKTPAPKTDHNQVLSDCNTKQRSMIQRAISKLKHKRCYLKNKFNDCFNNHSGVWNDVEYAERQNSVSTLDLFKYATIGERLAVVFGILFMWYAASWQPISVFILAIMASLMGDYSKKTAWLLKQLSNSSTSTSTITYQQQTEVAGENSTVTLADFLFSPDVHLMGGEAALSHIYSNSPPFSLSATSSHESLPFLEPLSSFIMPILDFTSTEQFSNQHDNASEYIKAAVNGILQHESNEFLRKSFEINGSAFVLALTQLAAFFFGMTLITWAAKKQASRVKILYFRSCLYQEVTWFESIDSASGSGSSLNSLVEKYEDGLGLKLALLCYFLGHVGLFAITAFYQMFNLASFCMSFVLVVGLIIAYLSEFQAFAIGEHALFVKRSLQLAEEIIASIRTVFAFNGQQKELTRYGISLQPVYRKSLVKHLYTAFNTSLSKFSIFACFASYCFYAMRLFPPYDKGPLNKAAVLAVMRGAEVSIVNILISIPFVEALQQSKGSIARIYAAIERRSKIDPSDGRGTKPSEGKWQPSISFRMVQFGYADRSGPTRRRSTLPYLNPQQQQPPLADSSARNLGGRRNSLIREIADGLEMDCNQSGLDTQSVDCSAISGQHSSAAGSAKRIIGPGIDKNNRQSTNKRVLNHFNLDIKAGQSVALVGSSGSGKSTVLSLVQRLYDITGGQLLIGQHSIKDLNVGWLRNQIGVVTQEPRLFDMSIAENIVLGLASDTGENESAALRLRDNENVLEAHSMQQVIEAARAASAHEFISRLPNGYSTRVGSGGVQLSGGQRQRIAIARALIRKPKILLLDESTSALDTESEAQVQKALKAASVGRTSLLVAHRLATIKHVDLIVVMSQGQVVECGNHFELMNGDQPGIYRQMYEDQLSAAKKISVPKRIFERPELENVQNKSSLQLSKVRGNNCDKDEDSNKRQVSDALSLTVNKSTNYKKDLGLALAFSCSKSSNSGAFDNDKDSGNDDGRNSVTLSSPQAEQVSARQLWEFIEMPKWSSIAAVITCLMAGLILPMNLIAHSYLFSAFAFKELDQIGDCLHLFGLLVLSFSTFVFIVSFLQVILPGYVGEKLSIRLRAKIMDSLLNKPMFYFDMDSNSTGALCDRFNSYISNIQSIAGTRVAIMLEAISTLMAGAIFGFGRNLSLSLFCLSFALLVLLTTIIESRIVQRESCLQQKFDVQLAHLMADALSNIKTIASLNKEKFFIDKFSEIIRQREVGKGFWIVWLRSFLTSLKFVMPAMSWSASMYYGCHLLVDGRIDLQTIFIVCPVVLFAVNDTFRALVFLPELLKARKSIERLYRMNREFSPQTLQTLTLAQQIEQQSQLHLLQQQTVGTAAVNTKRGEVGDPRKSISFVELAPSIKEINGHLAVGPLAVDQYDDKNPKELVDRRLSNLCALPTYMLHKSSRLNSLIPRSSVRGKIDFCEVDFAYPNRPSALVLDGFSLSIAPGESVALVGGSGSGKSTCVAILEKFYDFHAGKVQLDGHDLRLLDNKWIRSQVGLVSQEPTLLSYTIGDNIRYGDNSRFVSMDEVVEAARTANIHDFIMSLPDQYDTELSTSAYSSSQLSGGQRQRIAIARALIKNAPILVFDEATSALDSKNESLVQDALNKARRGRTNLTIAHRLATVKEADKIVVMHEGKVVEVGTHEQLMLNEHGHYRSLWERQQSAHSSTPPTN